MGAFPDFTLTFPTDDAPPEGIYAKLDHSVECDFALEKALHAMQASIRAGNTSQMLLTHEYVRLQSKVQALTTMMAELCLLQGMGAETFLGHLSHRTKVFHDTLLTSLETTDPDVAARFDNRDFLPSAGAGGGRGFMGEGDGLSWGLMLRGGREAGDPAGKRLIIWKSRLLLMMYRVKRWFVMITEPSGLSKSIFQEQLWAIRRIPNNGRRWSG